MKISSLFLALVLALFSIMTFAQAIDINTANVEQLQQIKGIGPKKAADIVKYRESHGPFGSVEDLTKVPGIGPKTLATNKDLLMVGGGVMPETPAMPGTPSAPVMPATPATPAMPAMPGTPSAPAMPAKPTLPVTPPQQ